MSKTKNILILIIIIVVLLLVKSFVFGSLINMIFPPSQASEHDKIVEDIGGDDFLVATLPGCLKTGEQEIPDGNFTGTYGTYGYYDAKNISYVNYNGKKSYMIVWKTSQDNYDEFNNDLENIYISDNAKDDKSKCFIEYSYESKDVYGIILGTDPIRYSESELMFGILNLNSSGFKLAYTTIYPTDSSSGFSSSQNHYHTVVGDRYSLSRSDPGAYYDHYEYGDNYDIDDYLEVEGYD